MSTYSIPSFIMVIVTGYVGLYHLLLYFRRYTQHREDLTFAVCCFMMALYGVFCVGMYNADSIEGGFIFQRGQVVSLTLIGTTFLWFVVDYLAVRSKTIRNVLSIFFTLSAIFVLFDQSPLSFRLDTPAIKHIVLPFGKQVTYFEVQPGFYIEFLSTMGVMVFVYAFIMAWREYRFGDKRKARSMIGAVMIFCVGLINDASVHIGLYSSVYIIEYGYMGIVLLMATSLSNEVVESALRKDALEESEKKYRELVDNSLVGIFIVQEQSIMFCNQRFAEIFGYQKPADVTGKRWDLFISPDEREIVLQEIFQFEQNKQQKQLEFKGLTKDEELIDIESYFGTIIIDHQPALQGTFLDISDRKAAEKKLKQSSEELKSYTLELEQFVNVTSHHLQEPLRSISSYVQLFAKRYHDQLDVKANEYIDFAVEGVNRMHRLINDFLVYTRVGKPWQAKSRLSLLTVVKRIVGHLSTILEENQVEVRVEQLPFVYGEESKLELLMKNIIMNAVNQKRDGSLLIEVFADKKENYWQVGVRDNGPGIAPQYHRLIFGLFQKLDHKGGDSSTGIGLSICKKIIEQHKGQIWVESDEGMGATFYFTFEDCIEQ